MSRSQQLSILPWFLEIQRHLCFSQLRSLYPLGDSVGRHISPHVGFLNIYSLQPAHSLTQPSLFPLPPRLLASPFKFYSMVQSTVPPKLKVTHIKSSLSPPSLTCEEKEMHLSFLPLVCKDVGGPQHILGLLQKYSLKIFPP